MQGILSKNAFKASALQYLQTDGECWLLVHTDVSSRVDWPHTHVITDYQNLGSSAIVREKHENIDVHLELIFVQMDYVWRDWVIKSFKMVALKHFLRVKTRLIAVGFWESLAFKEVEK